MSLSPSILVWLRCFEVASRHGSFARASEELNVTRGAVSQQISQLEHFVGAVLFQRLPGGLQLTAQGQCLKEEIEPALRCIEQAMAGLHRPCTPIRINCSPSFALRWLMPRLGGFMRRHPEISVEVTAEYDRLDRAAFSCRGIDVAIRCEPSDPPDLHAEALMNEYLLPVASPAFGKRHPRLEPALAIDEVVMLHDAEPWPGAAEHAEWHTWTENLPDRAVNPRRRLHFNLAHLAIAAALAGQGVAVARTALVLDDLMRGLLVPLSDRPIRSPARYALLTLDRQDFRVRAFADWLHEECGRFDANRQAALRELKLMTEMQSSRALPSLVA